MPPIAALTDEQSRALGTRKFSVALAAGAGCGKTFVLTERFLSHLEPEKEDAPDPTQLRQLIAITFTDAAAREMRARIRSKCYERLQSAGTAESQDYWLRLLRAIEAARVSTIHAFCASLLRTHAVAAGVDPAFGVLEQGEADVLVSEVIDNVLRDRLADRDDDTLSLAAACGLATLKAQLRELLKYRHEPHFRSWRDATVDELIAAWQVCYDRDAFPAALRELAESTAVEQVVQLLRGVDPVVTSDRFNDARGALLELLAALADGTITESQLATLRTSARVQSVCTVNDWPSPDAFDAYKTACEKLRKEIDKCLKLQFDADAARESAELGLRLLRFAVHTAESYEAAKARQGKLDFDDLLARAHRLLVDPDRATLRDELAGDLKLLLVDEFQDTDQLQVDLVRALCGDGIDAGKLFFVGDHKQSIYRFRGAQPKVFHDLRTTIPEPGQLPLSLNFRSQPAILNFVNALFAGAFGDGYEPLRPHRPQTTDQPAVEFLWTITPDKANRRLKGAARAARQQEARWIARRLRQLIDEAPPIIADAHGGARPLRLGDVAILFRALSDVDLYETALRELGLDYYLVGGHAFYSQQEIYDVLNLLRCVASPADEISLAGALRSPLFALADETLFWLVEVAGSLNDGLFGERWPAELPPEERAKVAAAADTLRYLRGQKDSLPIATLLGEALARTGYDAALLAEFLGERKLANLQKLVEQARAADQGGVLELSGFIAQLAEFVAREPKEALAATMSESADVIRLMTIHQAKGLEFPLVVPVDLDRKSDFRVPPAALDAELGPLVSLPQADEHDPPAPGMKLYRARETRADAEERLRLLYVATTRAADYLILSSSLADYDELQGEWMKLLAREFDLATGQLRGRLPAEYDTPQVRVTDQEPHTDRRPAGMARGPDLVKLLDEARALAERGAGVMPHEVQPVPVDAAARRHFSVSRLAGRIAGLEVDGDDRFSHEAQLPRKTVGVDPLRLGKLVHAVLERIPFGGDPQIAAWCERSAAELVLNPADAAVQTAREMLERFVASQRWRQIASAAEVHREVEFLLAWPPDGARAGGLMLQGYIDCLYRDAAGWHLVDYKTDATSAEECSRTAQQYEMQLAVYALASERAIGQMPVELVLHFLRPGAEHSMAWNDTARHRGIDRVNQAIRAVQSETLKPEP